MLISITLVFLLLVVDPVAAKADTLVNSQANLPISVNK